jgi:hypothetical protein
MACVKAAPQRSRALTKTREQELRSSCTTGATQSRLLPTSGTHKDIEILALRHQLAVVQCQLDKPGPHSATTSGKRACAVRAAHADSAQGAARL